MNLRSSVNRISKRVTKVFHFEGGIKRTIRNIKTDTIEQGEFTKFESGEGRFIYINTSKVLMFEVFNED